MFACFSVILFNVDVLALDHSVDEIVNAAMQIIYANEGSYGSVNANDNGAVSIGKVQWHGSRALNLLKSIVNADPSTAKTILGTSLYNEILEESNWSQRTVTFDEKSRISSLLVTPAGKEAQDSLAKTDISRYVNAGISRGMERGDVLVYYADMYNRGPVMANRIADSAANAAGSYANVTLSVIHNAAMSDAYCAANCICRSLNTHCTLKLYQYIGCSVPSKRADVPSGK